MATRFLTWMFPLCQKLDEANLELGWCLFFCLFVILPIMSI